MHRRNAAERAIRTFKAYFISPVAGVDDDFPTWPLSGLVGTPSRDNPEFAKIIMYQ